MCEATGEDIQALDHAESTEAKLVAEYGEVAVEELGGPADFGEDKHDDLEDDEQTVEHRPERARGLIWDCAVPVITNTLYQHPMHHK